MGANDQAAIDLAFEAAKFGAQWIAKRQLRKEEEDALLAELRRKEVARVIPTVEELERGGG